MFMYLLIKLLLWEGLPYGEDSCLDHCFLDHNHTKYREKKENLSQCDIFSTYYSFSVSVTQLVNISYT